MTTVKIVGQNLLKWSRKIIIYDMNIVDSNPNFSIIAPILLKTGIIKTGLNRFYALG